MRDAFGREEAARFFMCAGRRLDEPVRHAFSEALLARHREEFDRANA